MENQGFGGQTGCNLTKLVKFSQNPCIPDFFMLSFSMDSCTHFEVF